MTKVQEIQLMMKELDSQKEASEKLENEIKIKKASLKADRYNHGFKRGRIYKHLLYLPDLSPEVHQLTNLQHLSYPASPLLFHGFPLLG